MPTDFEPQDVVPTAIGELRITLTIPRSGGGADTRGEYRFEVLDEHNSLIIAREGDLAPHLTATEKQSIAAFMDTLLMRATASLPGS